MLYLNYDFQANLNTSAHIDQYHVQFIYSFFFARFFFSFFCDLVYQNLHNFGDLTMRETNTPYKTIIFKALLFVVGFFPFVFDVI